MATIPFNKKSVDDPTPTPSKIQNITLQYVKSALSKVDLVICYEDQEVSIVPIPIMGEIMTEEELMEVHKDLAKHAGNEFIRVCMDLSLLHQSDHQLSFHLNIRTMNTVGANDKETSVNKRCKL